MDKRTFINLALDRLQYISPVDFQECADLATAPLTDLTLIPGIMKHLTERIEVTHETIPFIIAVAYCLISPVKLHSNSIRLRVGIRDGISMGLGFKNPELVNHYSKFILPMWKNPRYKQKVQAEAETIMQIINNQTIKH